MLSVIIPTHNRRESLGRVLDALSACRCSVPFETVAVLDGCTDGTMQSLHSREFTFPLKVVELPGLGAAAARNAGVLHSGGDLLLFVDDDVIPEPEMLEAHVAVRREGFSGALVGPYPYAPELAVNPLDFFIRDWWKRRHEIMSDPDHTFTYHDCLTGNLSIPRDVFERVGGFDEAFRKDGREDYELGVRLLDAGVQLRFAPDAAARHYPSNKPKGLLAKWYTFGRADVYFCNKHPKVLETLPVVRYWSISPLARGMLKAAYPLVGRHSDRIIDRMASFFERRAERLWQGRMRGLWHISQQVSYLMGILSAGDGLRKLEGIAKESLGLQERARKTALLKGIDAGRIQTEINGTHEFNHLVLIPSLGGKTLGCVNVDCRRSEGAVRGTEIADILAREAGWKAIEHSILQEGCAEEPVWNSFTGSLQSGLALDLPLHTGASAGSIARITLPETCRSGNMKGRLLEMLRSTTAETLLLALPGDDADPGWQETASACLSEYDADCMLVPALLRSVRLRGEELYHEMADFLRTASSRPACPDSGSLAYMLDGFSPYTHRMVFRRRMLADIVERLDGRYGSYNQMAVAILIEAMRRYLHVACCPQAPVWRLAGPGIEEVRRMALHHAYLSAREVALLLRGGAPGRGRAFCALWKMAALYARKFVKSSARRMDWPVSFAGAEAVAFTRGCIAGLFFANKYDGGVL